MYQSQSQLTISVVILAPVVAAVMTRVAAVVAAVGAVAKVEAAVALAEAAVVLAVAALVGVVLGAKVALAAKVARAAEVARAEKVDLVALAQEDKAVPQAGAPLLKPLMPLLRTATPRRQLPHQSFQA